MIARRLDEAMAKHNARTQQGVYNNIFVLKWYYFYKIMAHVKTCKEIKQQVKWYIKSVWAVCKMIRDDLCWESSTCVSFSTSLNMCHFHTWCNCIRCFLSFQDSVLAPKNCLFGIGQILRGDFCFGMCGPTKYPYPPYR